MSAGQAGIAGRETGGAAFQIELAVDQRPRRITELGGKWSLAYPDSPTFNEFLVTGPGSGAELVAALARENILAGVPAHSWGGSWPDGLIVTATERNTVAEMEVLVNALGRFS